MVRYYQHSIWSENPKEWILSDRESFKEEVIDHRSLYVLKYDFQKDKTIYYFDHKTNSAYDWKMEILAYEH